MLKKRILVISWFYPPVNSSEGLVTYKLLKASKNNYDVFTQKNNALWSYGNKNELPDSENVKPIFAKSKKLEDWVEEAVDYYTKNSEKYDIIMTRSMPPESHKIGLKIKKINPKVKWIASFGDPIADNPYTKIAIECSSPHSVKTCTKFRGIISPKRIIRNAMFKIRYIKIQKTYLGENSKLQKSIISNADYLLFNSNEQKEYMLGEENKDKKSIVLNHSFDQSLYPKEKEEHKKIELNYVGHLDAIRTPKKLFEAINELYKEDEKLGEKVIFNFYGDMADSDKLFIINNELTDIIKIKKPVSYLTSLKIMKDSDWLIHVDADLSKIINKNIFFAAKLADYIGANNKIFGITMENGVSADILRNLNSIVTSYSAQEIKNYLWLIIYNNYSVEINEEYRKIFSSNEVAKNFDEFIKNI